MLLNNYFLLLGSTLSLEYAPPSTIDILQAFLGVQNVTFFEKHDIIEYLIWRVFEWEERMLNGCVFPIL